LAAQVSFWLFNETNHTVLEHEAKNWVRNSFDCKEWQL
jgi:hypothetical protein